mmetsp:Transcript_125/g.459  ORF Transcript_125/g.459 Transcript_125/m.459 type:complete len:223 (+) Transcript_125:1379-2047(+)
MRDARLSSATSSGAPGVVHCTAAAEGHARSMSAAIEVSLCLTTAAMPAASRARFDCSRGARAARATASMIYLACALVHVRGLGVKPGGHRTSMRAARSRSSNGAAGSPWPCSRESLESPSLPSVPSGRMRARASPPPKRPKSCSRPTRSAQGAPNTLFPPPLDPCPPAASSLAAASCSSSTTRISAPSSAPSLKDISPSLVDACAAAARDAPVSAWEYVAVS